MSVISSGIFKTIAIKKQTGLGVVAPAGAGGTSQYMRRVKSTIDADRKNYSSAEILPSQQQRDMRLGVYSVGGQVNGELSGAGYQPWMESLLRQAAQANITTGALTNVTATAVGTMKGTFTRATGNYITDGFNLGDIVSWIGWTAPATANNAHRMIVTNIGGAGTILTCTTLDGQAVVSKAAGDSVTLNTAGKKIYTPLTGQTRDYYTIEHFFADIVQSELFTDCVPTEMAIKAPGSGIVTVDWTVMGLGFVGAQAQYFTAPAAPATGTIEVSVNGLLMINGNLAATITGFDLSVKGNHTVQGGVVGSNYDPDVIPGKVTVSGQITALFVDNVYRDLFLNETESSTTLVLASNETQPNTPFTAFNMSRIKFSGQKKDDGEKGLILTMPFVALENYAAGGAGFPNIDTTLSIQDNQFI